jgi:hypothetical protein
VSWLALRHRAVSVFRLHFTRPMRMRYATGIVFAALVAGSCSDGSGPGDQLAAGRFTMQVRGPANLDLEGQAEVTPGLTSGGVQPIQRIHLVSVTPALFYRLEIIFMPPVPTPSGSFAVGPTSPIRATFYIVDRSTNEFAQIAPAQSGTLSLEECSLARCVGMLSGRFPLGSTVQQSTITADFHARLQ